MKKRIAGILIMMTMIVTMCVPVSFASSGYAPKYGGIYKDGKNVYCGGFFGVTKINLKSGKRTRILKYKASPTTAGKFSKKGKWIYFEDGYGGRLYRYNKSTGKKQIVYDSITQQKGSLYDYAVRGKKVYIVTGDPYFYPEEAKYYVMKLNGKGIKPTKTKIKWKQKYSNVKGYDIPYPSNSSTGKRKYYLITPKGKKYYLGYSN